MNAPAISVLIDTYNHERFIEQAITSVLGQNFPASGREIIVVDDGSTDRTRELIRNFEPRVRLITKQNGGQSSAFNAGVPECRGEIVAFLDGDDYWQPGKLSAVFAEFRAHPEIGAVGHGITEVDAAGEKLATYMPDQLFEVRLHTVQQAFEFLPLRMFLGTSRLAVRREILNRVLPLPAGLIVEADEFLIAHVVALAGARVLPQPLASYRLHAGNLYQFAEWIPARVQRKLDSLTCIVKELPARLASAGVASDVIGAVVSPVRLDVDRMRLSLHNGRLGEAARVEREAFRQSYRRASFGYHLFHAAVLAAAAVLPSTFFYRLRRWYSARGLARIRRLAGDATPHPSLHAQRIHPAESRK